MIKNNSSTDKNRIKRKKNTEKKKRKSDKMTEQEHCFNKIMGNLGKNEDNRKVSYFFP
jgi:hypothetical protein